ncbi:hypothetical protein Taro_029563 [Colocasia esculenta]|uniref:Uncharacterized protein n=1 Tax=Colocasia esculenta TaxID=4460 RepID=A0A843VTK8_COLES|nr:hypothetical protein [Colocasia esculenta]
MGGAEKELEEQLLDVGNKILSPPSSVDELLPLLDQAEILLSRVEQSPSKSMVAALDPARRGLSIKKLLGHSDIDVKIALASCVSEITRITAPEAPYDDDFMKVVFEMIVESFRKLEDRSSRSFLKRVSILETVAKVRSCVVMLDLECDSLILEMFQHFLNTIRNYHPENVFSSMESIMTVVLEESEDISLDLLSCLLMSVNKNNKDILPIARELAEKVIGNCALKLKPYLIEAVQSRGASLDDYGKLVAFICKGSLDVLEQNGIVVSGECLGSQKMESEITCPEFSATADKLSMSSVGNGTVSPKNATARLEVEKLETGLDRSTKKARRRKSNSAVQPKENSNHSPLESVELPSRRKGRRREVDTLQSGGAPKSEAEPTILKNGKTSRHRVPSEGPSHNSASVNFAADNGDLPASSHRKRGRSSGSEVSMKKLRRSPSGNVTVSTLGSKKCSVNGNIEDEAASSMDIDMKKQTENASGSEKKTLRRSGKKRHLENVDNGGKSNSHSDAGIDVLHPEERFHRRPGRKKASEGELSGKHWISRTKQQKGKAFSEEIVVGEQNQKISETPRRAMKYDESLVGVKIKVWWADDKQFYPGVVDSYDPATMRHKVLYVDGDEEVLLLKDENFQLLKGEKEGRKNDSTPEAAETPRKKVKKLDSPVKKSKVVSSSKSGGSAGKVSANGSKPGRKGGLNSAAKRQRGGSSKNDARTLGESQSEGKKRRRHNADTPKRSILSDDELDSKSKDRTPRATKTKHNSSKPGRKSKSSTLSIGSGSKDDLSKIVNEKSEASTTGLMAKVAATGTGRKLKKSDPASPGERRKRKSDANGSPKVEPRSSATKVSANSGETQGSEETSRKKRRKKAQS